MARGGEGAPGTDTAHLLCLGRNLVLSVISFNSASRQIKFTTLTSASCREMSRAQLETGSGVAECGSEGVQGSRVCAAQRWRISQVNCLILAVSQPQVSLSPSLSLSRLGPATCFVLLDLRVGGRRR